MAHGALLPVLLLAFFLSALAPLPVQAGEKMHSDLRWHAHGVSALATDSPADARRNEIRWTSRGMARAPLRPKPRPTILRVGAYEDSAAPARAAPEATDPDAHKDPFYVADQRARQSAPTEAPDELPIPDSIAQAAAPASELPLPEETEPLAAESTGELPIPDSSGVPAESASQPSATDNTDLTDEPMQLKRTEDELFSDDVPSPPNSELPLPSGDLSQGLSTEPGGVGCQDYAKQCQRALRELQNRDITTVVVGVVIEGTEGDDYPCDCRLGRDFEAANYVARDFSPTLFTWKAAGLCHKPLYFEDVQLERYGHSWNPVIQPFISGAHFFVSVPLLPYNMGLKPPHECVYTLGYYRPGNCAPYMWEPIPLSLRAAVWEGFGAAAFAFWFWPPN